MAKVERGIDALMNAINKPAGSQPNYLGAAPNRSDFSFLRYTPAKLSTRMERSLAALRDPNNAMRQEILANIENGLDVGADWYNTEELRDWFIMGYGEEEGHRQWSEFIDLVGAASPGSKVPPNIKNASAIRQRKYEDPAYLEQLQNVEKLEDARPLGKQRPTGYGHKTQGLQELIAARQTQGGWSGDAEPGVPPAKGSWTQNPKPKGFAQSLKGSERNMAADLHFTRYMAMASMDPDWLATAGTDVSNEFRDRILAAYPKAAAYFKDRKVDGKLVPSFNPKGAVKDGVVPIEEMAKEPAVWSQKPNDNEYGAFEEFMYELGQELGLTGPQTQAALWMGAAKQTNVADESLGTFMELFRETAAKTAAKTNRTQQEVIMDFIMNKGLLSASGAGVLGTAMSGNQAQASTPTQMEIMKYLEANQ